MSGEKKTPNIVLLLLLTVLILLISVVAFLFFSYRSWAVNFEEDMYTENFVSSLKEDEIKEINGRIEDSINSQNETIVLELSVRETAILMMQSFQKNEVFELDGIYIEPVEKGLWNIFLKIKISEKISLWTEIKMKKENRETAELFLEDLLVGGYSLKTFGFADTISDINQSLSSSLVTVVENNFTGRRIQNIELLETGLVARLEKY